MNSFTIKIPADACVQSVLSQTLSELPSLCASDKQWAAYVRGRGVQLRYGYVEPPYDSHIAARDIIAHAAERVIDFAAIDSMCISRSTAGIERATYIVEEGMFVTPEGDRVTVCKAELEEGENHYCSNGVVLSVELSPKSEHLATIMLAQLLRHVPAAAPLLAKAARAAAKKS